MLTQTGPEDKKPRRRIMDFSLHDGNGNLQPFEMSRSNGITITALVTPLDDGIERNKKKGIRCERFGPIKDWTISSYREGTEVIWLSTELADYKCVKPIRSYMSYYDPFSKKAWSKSISICRRNDPC
jgi:DNA (cytosine-5)-methyltransferase 1